MQQEINGSLRMIEPTGRKDIMDPKKIAKEMIEFNKTAFDNNFSAMNALHEQTERIINKFLEKSQMFPEDDKKVISEWMKTYKKGCEDFKKTIDENFKKVEDIFATGGTGGTGPRKK
jgi:hypothetical protein